MLKAGITGGIGSGKTLVSGVFLKMGVPVYNSDLRAKKLMETDSDLINDLIRLTGADILKDGKLNKDVLSKYIFHDPVLKQKINSVVHPVVFQDWDKWCSAQSSIYVMIESALLFQTEYYKKLDAVIIVESDIQSRVQRLVLRDGITAEEALTRINSQGFNVPSEPENNFHFIQNNGKDEMLLHQIIAIHTKLKSR